ncbi:6613_t:CDS:1 [Diversispora eburnea]|uniref:6613_t:CDS:1 n=2 Tax=Diversisporales TaxID=214509 RepID=A0A9N8ZUM4_9GLOM|nr:6613_t:CDS:1 [Diversispora eburnea]
MAQVAKIQRLLQQLEINFDEGSFRVLFSHVIRNHESFDKDDWKDLIQFDKNWETFGFETAKAIYSSVNTNKMRQGSKLSTKGFVNESRGKQVKTHPQHMHGEANSSNSISQWKCNKCGYNPNFVWRVKCYRCKAFRSDLDLESFNLNKVPSTALSAYDRRLLDSELIWAKGDKAEEEVKAMGYKYFDWLNGWSKTPAEVERCRKLGHKQRDDLYSRTGSRNLVRCDTCKYYYHYDCS